MPSSQHHSQLSSFDIPSYKAITGSLLSSGISSPVRSINLLTASDWSNSVLRISQHRIPLARNSNAGEFLNFHARPRTKIRGNSTSSSRANKIKAAFVQGGAVQLRRETSNTDVIWDKLSSINSRNRRISKQSNSGNRIGILDKYNISNNNYYSIRVCGKSETIHRRVKVESNRTRLESESSTSGTSDNSTSNSNIYSSASTNSASRIKISGRSKSLFKNNRNMQDSSTNTEVSSNASSNISTIPPSINQLSNMLLPPERASRYLSQLETLSNVSRSTSASSASNISDQEEVIKSVKSSSSIKQFGKELTPLQEWKRRVVHEAIPQQNSLERHIRGHIDKLTKLDEDLDNANPSALAGEGKLGILKKSQHNISHVSDDGSMDWVKNTDSYCLTKLQNKKQRPKPQGTSVNYYTCY